MLRNRLVRETNGEERVSSVLLTDDEIQEALDFEELLHRAGGWDVRGYGPIRRFQKDDVVRWVWVRSRTPLEDKT